MNKDRTTPAADTITATEVDLELLRAFYGEHCVDWSQVKTRADVLRAWDALLEGKRIRARMGISA